MRAILRFLATSGMAGPSKLVVAGTKAITYSEYGNPAVHEYGDQQLPAILARTWQASWSQHSPASSSSVRRSSPTPQGLRPRRQLRRKHRAAGADPGEEARSTRLERIGRPAAGWPHRLPGTQPAGSLIRRECPDLMWIGWHEVPWQSRPPWPRGVSVIATAAEKNHEFLQPLGVEPAAYGNGLADRVRGHASTVSTLSPISSVEISKPRCRSWPKTDDTPPSLTAT